MVVVAAVLGAGLQEIAPGRRRGLGVVAVERPVRPVARTVRHEVGEVRRAPRGRVALRHEQLVQPVADSGGVGGVRGEVRLPHRLFDQQDVADGVKVLVEGAALLRLHVVARDRMVPFAGKAGGALAGTGIGQTALLNGRDHGPDQSLGDLHIPVLIVLRLRIAALLRKLREYEQRPGQPGLAHGIVGLALVIELGDAADGRLEGEILAHHVLHRDIFGRILLERGAGVGLHERTVDHAADDLRHGTTLVAGVDQRVRPLVLPTLAVGADAGADALPPAGQLDVRIDGAVLALAVLRIVGGDEAGILAARLLLFRERPVGQQDRAEHEQRTGDEKAELHVVPDRMRALGPKPLVRRDRRRFQGSRNRPRRATDRISDRARRHEKTPAGPRGRPAFEAR